MFIQIHVPTSTELIAPQISMNLKLSTFIVSLYFVFGMVTALPMIPRLPDAPTHLSEPLGPMDYTGPTTTLQLADWDDKECMMYDVAFKEEPPNNLNHCDQTSCKAAGARCQYDSKSTMCIRSHFMIQAKECNNCDCRRQSTRVYTSRAGSSRS